MPLKKIEGVKYTDRESVEIRLFNRYENDLENVSWNEILRVGYYFELWTEMQAIIDLFNRRGGKKKVDYVVPPKKKYNLDELS